MDPGSIKKSFYYFRQVLYMSLERRDIFKRRDSFQEKNLQLLKKYHTTTSKLEKKKILEELLKRNEKYVIHLYRQIAQSIDMNKLKVFWIEREDILQIIRLVLIETINRFDPKKSTSLNTLFYKKAFWAVIDFIWKQFNTIFRLSSGNKSLKVINESLMKSDIIVLRFGKPVNSDGIKDEQLFLEEIVASDWEDPENIFEKKELIEKILELIENKRNEGDKAFEILKETILSWEKQNQIAKEKWLSPARVNQLKKKAIRQIKDILSL